MRESVSKNEKGDTLFIESMFDPCYAHQIEIYLKNCTAHNLPKDHYIGDHWHKPPFEITEVQFASIEENEDENMVKQATFKLYFHTFSEPDFYWIKAGSFYFDKVS